MLKVRHSMLKVQRIHKQLFSAILGEKSTVARGCTRLEDESKYICDTHKAGSYVSKMQKRNVNSFDSKYVKNKRYFLNTGVHIVQLPWRRLQ